MSSGTMMGVFISVAGLEVFKMGGKKGMELISCLENTYSKEILQVEREMGEGLKKSMPKKLVPYQLIKILKIPKNFLCMKEIGRMVRNMAKENFSINMESFIQDVGNITLNMVMGN